MEEKDEKLIFVNNLRRCMEMRNIDRNKLASKLGVAYTTVNEWYTGASYPRYDKLKAIADALNVFKSDLVEDERSNARRGIPVLARIPAGMPFEAIQERFVDDYIQPPRKWNHDSSNYFALKIVDNSMQPKYQNGDYVIFNSEFSDFSGMDCCVLIDNQDAIFKRVTKSANGLLIEPLNIHNDSNFLPVQYSPEECINKSIKILGVALFSFSEIQYDK